MSEPAGALSFAKAIVVMAIGGLFVKAGLDSGPLPFAVSARGMSEERGEYGGDLGFLRRFHVGPQSEYESNHYFDLWSPGALPALAKVNGLTNNRALIVDSHGRAGFLWHGRGYGLYPQDTLLQEDQTTPCFSAADFAKVLGRDKVANVHNIVIAGCNEQGLFRSRGEWRRHFANATNIIHVARQAGLQDHVLPGDGHALLRDQTTLREGNGATTELNAASKSALPPERSRWEPTSPISTCLAVASHIGRSGLDAARTRPPSEGKVASGPRPCRRASVVLLGNGCLVLWRICRSWRAVPALFFLTYVKVDSAPSADSNS